MEEEREFIWGHGEFEASCIQMSFMQIVYTGLKHMRERAELQI